MASSVNVTTNISANFPHEPANKNYLKPNSFKFLIHRLPNVEYFCQSANIPKLTLGAAIQPTPFRDIPHVGDKLEFDYLNITFIVDETMNNYIELHQWIVGLGFPKSHSQFASLIKNPSTTFLGSEKMLESSVYSDASLFVLDSNNNPVVEIRFYDIMPSSIEGLDFDIRIPTVDYFTGIATFAYKYYEIHKLSDNYTYDPNI